MFFLVFLSNKKKFLKGPSKRDKTLAIHQAKAMKNNSTDHAVSEFYNVKELQVGSIYMYLTSESDVCFLLLFINVSFSQNRLAFWVVTYLERNYALYLAALFKMSHPGMLQISPIISFILKMGMHAIVFTYLRKCENNISNLRCCVEPISRKNSRITSWHQPGNFITSITAFIVKWIFIFTFISFHPLASQWFLKLRLFGLCRQDSTMTGGEAWVLYLWWFWEGFPSPLLDVTMHGGWHYLISQTRCGIVAGPEGSDPPQSDDQ